MVEFRQPTILEEYLFKDRSTDWTKPIEKIEITSDMQNEINKLNKVIELHKKSNNIFYELTQVKSKDKERDLKFEYDEINREIKRLMPDGNITSAEDYRLVILNGKAKTVKEAQQVIKEAYEYHIKKQQGVKNE